MECKLKNNFFIWFFSILFLSNVYANEKVTLQLKWFHQFQFAGYYAAKEKGFYEDVGLDVEIKERNLKYNNIDEVIKGNAQYGIADSILILYKIKNEPIVIISPIFQHSPSVFISLKQKNIDSVYELNNKNILFYPNDTDGFSLLAMLKKFEINANLDRKREKDDYIKLISGEVDLMPAYIANEPFLFKEKGYDVNIINPTHYGFDIYGDIIFTNKYEAENYPQRVKKFREATLKGWNYALDNKEEMVQLIHEKYAKDKSIEHLRYEANAIETLIAREIIPLGYLDKGRIQYISELYKYYGLTDSKINLNEFIFDDFVKKGSKISLSEEEKEYLEKNPILKVHSMDSFPPFNFRVNEQPTGFLVDYLQFVSQKLNIKIEYIKDKTWKESLEMLRNGEIDLVPNVAINDERKKYIDFTDFSLVNYQIAIATKKDLNVLKLDDLKGKTISLLENSFLHNILEKKYPHINLYPTKTIKEAIEAVSSGKSDAVIDNLTTLEYYISTNWLSNLKTTSLANDGVLPTNVPLYMGLKKDNMILKSILEKVNKSISEKEIIELVDIWFNKHFQEEIKLTKQEHNYLSNKRKLNYCINKDLMPIEKIENDKTVGINAEYIKIFKEKLGVDFNVIAADNLEKSLNKLENSNCDFASFVLKNKSNLNKFNFSDSYLSFPLVLTTRLEEPFINTLQNLDSKKIAIMKNSGYKELIINENSNIRFVEVSSVTEGLQKVENKEVFGFVEILPVVGHELQKGFSSSLKISKELFSDLNFYMVTLKNDFILIDILNKLLKTVPNETKEIILNKWTSINYEKSVDYQKVFFVSLFFIFIIFIIYLKNRQINKINNQMKKYIKIVDENVLTSSTDVKGRIVYVSKAFCEISGYTKEELIGQNHRIIRHEDMPKKLFKELWNTITDGKVWQGEIKNKKKNGEFYWVKATISPLFDDNKNIIGYTAVREDITDKKRIEEISITDELTGLYNRRFFNEIFEREVNRAKREEHSFALIIFDVDFFKLYNDNYGHQAGDLVLQTIGKKIKELCKRSSDFAFRIGGEEFAVIFTPHFKENAVEFANLINKEIENLKIEHKYNKASSYITASIGLYTQVGEKIDTTKEIYQFTDLALYEAKKNGRNGYVVFNKNLLKEKE